MNRASAVPILLVACLSCTSATRGVDRRLEFSVDPRIELLAAVQLLSGYHERYSLLTRFDSDYRDSMVTHFEPFADHPAVKLFDTMSVHGFSFDAPPAVMLHLSPPPALELQAEIPEDLIRRAGGKE